MKKKVIIAMIIVVLFIFLIPIPIKLKDGGTIEYKALLYKVSRGHSLDLVEEMENNKNYNEGIIVEILGFEIYNNVK